MANSLKAYFHKKVDVVLFWVGGLITILWIRLLTLEAYNKNVPGHTLSAELTVFYILVLAFCLGIKGVRKRYNNEEDRDQYLGEIWAVVLFLTTFIVIHDYLSGGFKFFGRVDKIPSQLVLSSLGVMGLFGMTKVFDVWTWVKVVLKGKLPAN